MALIRKPGLQAGSHPEGKPETNARTQDEKPDAAPSEIEATDTTPHPAINQGWVKYHHEKIDKSQIQELDRATFSSKGITGISLFNAACDKYIESHPRQLPPAIWVSTLDIKDVEKGLFMRFGLTLQQTKQTIPYHCGPALIPVWVPIYIDHLLPKDTVAYALPEFVYTP